jgi:hypothetical protein
MVRCRPPVHTAVRAEPDHAAAWRTARPALGVRLGSPALGPRSARSLLRPLTHVLTNGSRGRSPDGLNGVVSSLAVSAQSYLVLRPLTTLGPHAFTENGFRPYVRRFSVRGHDQQLGSSSSASWKMPPVRVRVGRPTERQAAEVVLAALPTGRLRGAPRRSQRRHRGPGGRAREHPRARPLDVRRKRRCVAGSMPPVASRTHRTVEACGLGERAAVGADAARAGASRGRSSGELKRRRPFRWP